MRGVRAPAVLLGGGVSERPRPSRFGSLDHHPHPNPRGWPLSRGYKPSLCLNFSSFSLSFRDLSFGVQKREGRVRVSVQTRGFWGAVACGLWGDTEFSACSQAALLLSLLWMPALLPVASRLLSLPRALTAMASGSPPAQPSPAADSGYVPGSVSAAFVTCPNEKVAKEIARAVVEKRLAACVNLIPQITSIYEWKGKIEEDSEVLMMIKTPSSLVPALTDFVRSVHPYEVAEVISLPVEQGNSPYLRWVHQVTEAASDPSTVPP